MLRSIFYCDLGRLFTVVVLSASIWAGSPADTCAQQPIPAGTDAYTHAKYTLDYYKYLQRDVEAYKKHTLDKGQARELGIKFLEEFIKVRCNHPERKSNVEVTKLASAWKKQVAEGGEDRWLLACLAAINLWAGEWETARYSKTALEPVETARNLSDYGSRYVYLARRWNVNRMTRRGGTLDEVRKAYRETIPFAITWLKEERPGKNKSLERRIHWMQIHYLLDAFKPAQKREFRKACEKAEGLDPWFLEMIAGLTDFEEAWEWRGGGYAYTVSPESMKKFREYLVRAKVHFEKAIELEPNVPHSARWLLSIHRCFADKETTRKWFDRAVAIQLDFEPAYNEYLFSLRPRWGGSYSEMYRFGLECLRTKRFDTIVPTEFLDIVITIDQEMGDQSDVWFRKGVYANLKTLFVGLEDLPNPTDNKWYRSWHAAIAAKVGAHEDAAQRFKELKDDINEKPFQRLGLDYRDVKARSIALGGNVGEIAQQIQDLLESDEPITETKLVQLEAMLEAALKENDEPLAEPYLRTLEKTFHFRKDFESGQWVNLRFDKKLKGWRQKDGDWKVEADGAVSVSFPKVTSGRRPRLEFTPGISDSFEVEVEIDVAPSAKAHERMKYKTFMGGLVVGQVKPHVSDPRKSYRRPLRGGCLSAGSGELYAVVQPTQKKKIRLRVWPTCFEMIVDERIYTRGWDSRFDPSGGLALGIMPDLSMLGTMRFHNLRVCKLALPPPPREEDAEANENYYGQRIKANKDDLAAYYWRGSARFDQGKIDTARADFEKLFAANPKWVHYYWKTGLTYEQEENYKKALELYEKGAATKPGVSFTLSRLLILLTAAPDDSIRNKGRAHEVYVALWNVGGNDLPEGAEAIASYDADRGKYKHAISWLKTALRQFPEEEHSGLIERIELYRQKKPYRLGAKSTPDGKK